MEDKNYINKKRNIFDIVYLSIVALYFFILWCIGYNFLALPGLVLGVVASLIILIRVLIKREIGIYMWIAYMVSLLGLFIYFLIWGAHSFGRNLWWNLILEIGPVGLALIIYFANKIVPEKFIKLTASICSILMIGTCAVYALFMDLRARVTTISLQEGHDKYLNTIKTKYSTNESSPNVLVILMDDMAYSDISSYSYMKKDGKEPTINTPNIDSIAANGIMMENFYSSSPVCSPSRFSILTGRYSSRGYLDNVVFPSDINSDPWSPTHFINPYQFYNNVDGILGDEITFAEVLQQSGYSTACIGKWNLGDYGQYLPTNQGFDYFYGSYYVNDMTPYNWVRDTKEGAHEVVRTHKENLDQSMSTSIFTQEVQTFIESSTTDNKKFFAYYTSPWPHFPIYSNNNGNGQGDKTDDTYIACIEEFDKSLGDLFDYMKNTDDPSGNGSIYDNTLVIFTSDNGPGREGVTGSLRGRKNTPFEGGMKVPLIASYPNGGLGAGVAIESKEFYYNKWVGEGKKTKSEERTIANTKMIDTSAMNFDLYTTILKYCGIVNEDGSVYLPTDRIIDGVSLYDLWQCNVDASTRVHNKLFYQKKGTTKAIQMPVELDGVVYDFKYYDNVQTENSAFFDQFYKKYLFNLDLDPAEGYSITKTYPEIANILAEELKAFQKEMKTNRRGVIKN